MLSIDIPCTAIPIPHFTFTYENDEQIIEKIPGIAGWLSRWVQEWAWGCRQRCREHPRSPDEPSAHWETSVTCPRSPGSGFASCPWLDSAATNQSHCINPSVNQSIFQTVNQSAFHSIKLYDWLSQSVDQTISRSVQQSNQSINHSVSQSSSHQ